jgi:hypothetical protein
MPKVLTIQKCHCGTYLELEVANPGIQKGVGWGHFSRDAGRHNFTLRCVCRNCGAVFDPDHPRFAANYNMAANGAYSSAQAQSLSTAASRLGAVVFFCCLSSWEFGTMLEPF